MKIDYLRLEDYRCFEKAVIHFHEQLTVFAASNGMGKTSILEAIATSLSPYIIQFEYGQNEELPKLKESDVHRRKIHDPEHRGMFTTEKSPAPAHIKGKFSRKNILRYGGEFSEMSSTLSSEVGEVSSQERISLSHYGEFLNKGVYDGKRVILPVVAYYGTGRLHAHQNLDSIDQEKFTTLEESRARGYYECLSSKASYGHFLYGIKIWAEESYQQYLLAKEGKQATEYYNVLIRRVMGAIESCLEDHEYQQLKYSPSHKDFVMNTPNGVLPLSQLSDGLRNIITMVGDIAYRLYSLNPWVADPIEGIVMIDEIEMHLHPSWQQTILRKLMKTFPKVQFIVTTHSPQVLSTVKRKSIRVIENGTVRLPDEETWALESSTILSQTMGVNPLPDLQVNRLYLELMDQIEEGEEVDLEAFMKELGENAEHHPAYLDLLRRQRLVGYKKRLVEKK